MTTVFLEVVNALGSFFVKFCNCLRYFVTNVSWLCLINGINFEQSMRHGQVWILTIVAFLCSPLLPWQENGLRDRPQGARRSAKLILLTHLALLKSTGLVLRWHKHLTILSIASSIACCSWTWSVRCQFHRSKESLRIQQGQVLRRLCLMHWFPLLRSSCTGGIVLTNWQPIDEIWGNDLGRMILAHERNLLAG